MSSACIYVPFLSKYSELSEKNECFNAKMMVSSLQLMKNNEMYMN